MQNKTKFNPFIHFFIYLVSAVSFSLFLDYSMVDDGLRHIAFSYNQEEMKSWGEVFPFSLFSEYDPWFLWHTFLSFFSSFISYEHIHIFINILVLFILMILVDVHLRKNSQFNFSSVFYIVVLSIVYLTSYRYLIIRPDLLSGIYVMAALLLSNRFFPIFILTLVYGPFYYLFFIYSGSIGLVYLILKNKKGFLGVFTSSILVLLIHLFVDINGYITTVKNILLDQQLRMGLEVGEGKPLFEMFTNLNYFILLPSFLALSIYLIYKYYSYFEKNKIALLLLITSILWVNQIRYYSLFLPLIVIFIITFIVNMNKKTFLIGFRKYIVLIKRNINITKNRKVFYFIAIPYTIIALSFAFHTRSLNSEVQRGEFFKNPIFDEKLILLNRIHIDIYKALYHNPTVKFVPSCSVGWFDNKNEKMKDIYIRMQKKEGVDESELFALIQYINADFYIHYLRNEEQLLDFEKLKKFGIIPKLIYQNKIIFKIERKDNT